MATITHTAPEAVSLDSFKDWLKSRQTAAIAGMKATREDRYSSTNPAFENHFNELSRCLDLLREVEQFECERGA